MKAVTLLGILALALAIFIPSAKAEPAAFALADAFADADPDAFADADPDAFANAFAEGAADALAEAAAEPGKLKDNIIDIFRELTVRALKWGQKKLEEQRKPQT